MRSVRCVTNPEARAQNNTCCEPLQPAPRRVSVCERLASWVEAWYRSLCRKARREYRSSKHCASETREAAELTAKQLGSRLLQTLLKIPPALLSRDEGALRRVETILLLG